MKACWHCGCDGEGFPEGGGGCSKGPVSPGPEVGPDGVHEVGEGGSEREGGARLLRALKVMSSILKSIRYLTGSQWRSWRKGVWSERWVDVSIRAAKV